jgi:signal transduction histidine kinase
VEIEVLKVTWNKERDDGSYNQMTSEWSEKELEWHWENPVIQAGEKQEISTYQMSAVVPNLAYGFSGWKRWQSDEHLQNLPELLSEWKPVKTSYSILTPIKVADCIELDNGCVLVYHQTTKPLLAAMDHLKYVYLGSLIMVFICIRKVLAVMEETNKEREKVEEMRRDFSNAIAHEMKTPLGVVRGFAENLKENTNEDKQGYYIDQIVNQTEHMDEMIKEMIYVSKLDPDKVVLNKTEISMKKLLEEVEETLRSNIEEKQLSITYHGLPDFVVIGDLQYLKKAVWNIISNAVEYNQIGGRIEIVFEENLCKIRNTGKQISEEDLEHVFDMFYTGNKSRSSEEKHLGLGLYLAKKIFDLHGLRVSIENMKDGVEVTITR